MTRRDASDVSVQTAFIGHSEDDRQFRAEKRRKYGPKVVLDPIPDGPCCNNCRNWRASETKDPFGTCRLLVTVRERVSMGPQPGTTLGIEDVRDVDFEWEFMRTRPAFAGCSRYAVAAASVDAESEAAA